VSLIELPFDLPDQVFRSPMPFGPYDLHGEVNDQFCEEQIAVIVLLASDEACFHKTGCKRLLRRGLKRTWSLPPGASRKQASGRGM
jgi:hypothetical protein